MPHRMYEKCACKTYEHTQQWFSRAKSPDKGRPFNRWGKVLKSGDDFLVLVNNEQVCRITPDNKLTMCIDANRGRAISNTLSSSLQRLVPITWTRVGMKRYRIMGTRTLKPDDSWWVKSREAPELFEGLQFDLLTGLPTNAKPDMVTRVDTEARREWLRALRRFKTQIQLRVKMGVFDGVQHELNAHPNGIAKPFNGRVPDWGSEKWMDLLHTSIRDNQYPKELLAGFLLTMPTVVWRAGYARQSMKESMKLTLNHVINSNSIELRARFGVFSDEVTSNGKAKQD